VAALASALLAYEGNNWKLNVTYGAVITLGYGIVTAGAFAEY